MFLLNENIKIPIKILKIIINREHLEENDEKLIHRSYEESLINLNRTGIPLIEKYQILIL